MSARSGFGRLLERIDARTRRERLLLFGAAVALVVLAWEAAVRAPLAERIRAGGERVESLESDIATMRASRESLEERIASLEDSDVERRVAALEERIAAVEGEVEARTRDLISPNETVAVLRAILAGEERLDLVALRNDDAESIFGADAPDPALDVAPNVFRHRVELVLRGEYFALLDYLRRIEGLEWRFRWDALNVETLDYPVAEAVVVLSTLSFAEGWIGV